MQRRMISPSGATIFFMLIMETNLCRCSLMLGDGVVAAVGGSVGAGVELDGVAPFVLDAPDG